MDQDSTLVERCLGGEATAWEALVRLHTRRVYSICYRFTGRDSDSQDLTQDVFMRVFRALGGFRSTEGSFATWLTRLTRNLLIDHYRRTKNERVTDSIEEQLPVTVQPRGLPCEGAGRKKSEKTSLRTWTFGAEPGNLDVWGAPTASNGVRQPVPGRNPGVLNARTSVCGARSSNSARS